MDLDIVKNKVVNVAFSKRERMNKDFSNWFKSSEKKAFLTLHNTFLSQNNEVTLKFKAPTHVMEDINKGKVIVNPEEIFLPDEIFEELNKLLDQQMSVKIGRADLNNLTLADFL